jgi:hypothetical protein
MKFFTKPLGLSLVLAAGLLAGGGPAVATNMFDPEVNSCSDVNCGSVKMGGTVLVSSDFPLPWVAQIAAQKGECLRIEVTHQQTDLEALLIAPDGQRWISTRGVTGGQGPLILANNLPQHGWYTLQLSHQSGLPVNADFDLAFGRYPLNDRVNCQFMVDQVLEDTEDTTE